MSRLEVVNGTEIVFAEGEEIRLGHTWHEFDVLKNFILNQPINWFVEIGVHEGGLSYMLLPILPVPCWYAGIEKECWIVRSPVVNLYSHRPNSRLYCMDCFSYQAYGIIGELQDLGNGIIYCDGGNKATELIVYSPFCKSGDIIMAHDYYDSIRTVTDVLEPHAEVTPDDAKILDNNWHFERLDESVFNTTRIIGWKRK